MEEEAEQHQEEEDHHQLMGEDSHQHHRGTFTMEVTQDPEPPYRVTHLVIRVLHHPLCMGSPLEASLLIHPDRWLQLLRLSLNEYSYGSLTSRHIQNTKGLKIGHCGYFGSRTLCSHKE